ncbi:porin [Rhizobium sp. CF080]|uniref:porin n=1 Tax=Rhizobium sp. (strain CF080) TaxID=1144310 RepID=UPI0002719A74|nr:porin [Rhizobium sp. CF080]EUB95178.1 porin [Rhizobium sp. CF080]
MNIKSLLLGSAAALAAVSGAQAADAIVAAEPEPMEYVRVCDAFGTGYFYIPGTETCLKIGGYVRFQVDFGDTTAGLASNLANGGDWDAWTRGRLEVVSKSDTELGTLTGFIAFQAEASQDSLSAVTDPFYFDEVYLQLGGFKAGTYLNWWDKGINGETDSLGSNRLASISYTYTGSSFSAGVQLDEVSRSNAVGVSGEAQGLGVEAIVSAKLGPVALDLLGSYDIEAEDGAIRLLGSAAIGPGTLQGAVVWSSGEGETGAGQIYYAESEWTTAVSYAYKATDKLTLTPGFQYYWNSAAGAGDFEGDNFYRAGLTVDYAIVSGLSTKVSVQYQDEHDGIDDTWVGFVRLQRTF